MSPERERRGRDPIFASATVFVPSNLYPKGGREREKAKKSQESGWRGEAADFYNIPGISSDPENNRLDYGKRQNTSL